MVLDESDVNRRSKKVCFTVCMSSMQVFSWPETGARHRYVVRRRHSDKILETGYERLLLRASFDVHDISAYV